MSKERIFSRRWSNQQNKIFTLKFRNFNSDNDVEVLIGREIFVDEANIVKLPENYFFIHDLVGSRVFRNEIIFTSE